MTDLDDRDERVVAAALREFVDRIPLSESGSGHPAPATSGRRRHPLALPALVAAAVVAILVTVNLAAGGNSGRSADPADGASLAVLPDRIAGYSYVNSRAESMPPGPGILSFQHGLGVEVVDYPQQVLVGADGVSYRRVGTAGERGRRNIDSDQAPTLLSPDGGVLAVGALGDAGSVALVNLRTGTRRTIAISENTRITPQAWSPDGRQLYVTHDRARNASPAIDWLESENLGVLVRIDVLDGVAHAYQPEIVTESVATSPDGSSLALSTRGTAGLRVVSALTGELVRVLPRFPGNNLGENAWSPDGRRLALVTDDSLIVVSTADGRSVTHVVGGGIDGLGWTSNSGYLTYRVRFGVDQEADLVNVDATTGEVTRLSRFASDPGRFAVGKVTAARDLVLSWQVQPAGWPRRGPGPMWFQAVMILTAIVVGQSLTRLARRQAVRRRPRKAPLGPLFGA